MSVAFMEPQGSTQAHAQISQPGRQRQRQRPRPRQQQNAPRTQVQVQRPAARVAAGGPSAATQRTVVIGDMVVAEDSDSDVIEDCQDEERHDDCQPKMLRVVSRTRPYASSSGNASKAAIPEPSWHALLRRTPSSRTASIARSLPRAAPPRTAQQAQQTEGLQQQQQGTLSRIIRTHGPQRPAVNVPAKVLMPRSRLVLASRLLPAGPAGTHVRLPLGALGGGVVYRGCKADLLPAAQRGFPLRRDQMVSGFRRVVVSAVGPLSPAESAVLDGVVEMEIEQEARLGGILTFMEKYDVKGSDTFSDNFPISPAP